MTASEHAVPPVAAQLVDDRMLGQQDPRGVALIARDEDTVERIVTAEMEEAQRSLTGDQRPVSRSRERAFVHVPVRNVPSAVTDDRVSEQRRDLVDPALVDEHAAGRVDPARPVKALVPELEKRPRAGRHGDEAEVEHARVVNRAIGEVPPIQRERVENVRRQHDLVGRCDVLQLREGAIEDDVRVEVDRRRRSAREQRTKSRGFHRRGEFEDVVHRAPAVYLGKVEAEIAER